MFHFLLLLIFVIVVVAILVAMFRGLGSYGPYR